jgi:hypothetical protein
MTVALSTIASTSESTPSSVQGNAVVRGGGGLHKSKERVESHPEDDMQVNHNKQMDFTKMKASELQKELESRGVVAGKKLKKSELIEMLQEAIKKEELQVCLCVCVRT